MTKKTELPVTPDRFIKRPEVMQMTALPSSTITYLISRGEFPKPLKLSQRASAWRLSEVVAWMDSRKPENVEAA